MSKQDDTPEHSINCQKRGAHRLDQCSDTPERPKGQEISRPLVAVCRFDRLSRSQVRRLVTQIGGVAELVQDADPSRPLTLSLSEEEARILLTPDPFTLNDEDYHKLMCVYDRIEELLP